MAKLLNLDEVNPPAEKVIKLKGKEHVMAPITVKKFLEVTKEAEEGRLNKELTITGQFNQFIDSITDAFPTIERADLEGLELSQLKVIIDFMREAGEEEAADAEGDGVKKSEAAE